MTGRLTVITGGDARAKRALARRIKSLDPYGTQIVEAAQYNWFSVGYLIDVKHVVAIACGGRAASEIDIPYENYEERMVPIMSCKYCYHCTVDSVEDEYATTEDNV